MLKLFEEHADTLKKTEYYKLYLSGKGVIPQSEYAEYMLKVDKALHKDTIRLAKILTDADEIAVKDTNAVLSKKYAEAANKLLYEVEKGISMRVELNLVNPEAVYRTVKGRFFRNLKRVKAMGWNTRRISSAITAGVLKGENTAKVAKRLMTLVDGNKSTAVRNARTWVNSAQNGGRFDESEALQEAGVIMKKQWLSTGDERVRDSHRELDGEVQNIDEPFSNGGMYPSDPSLPDDEYYNCRCTMLTYPDGFTPDLSARKMDIGGMSYDEWKHAR